MSDSWEFIELDEFDCKICTQNKKIVNLTCKHTLCEECLTKIRKEAIKNKQPNAFKCPFCRSNINIKQELKAW